MDDYSDTENDDTGPAPPEEIGHKHTDINPNTFYNYMYENIVIQALLNNKFIFQIRKLNNRKWIESII